MALLSNSINLFHTSCLCATLLNSSLLSWRYFFTCKLSVKKRVGLKIKIRNLCSLCLVGFEKLLSEVYTMQRAEEETFVNGHGKNRE